MSTKHQAISPLTGETFTRTSRDRVYSHAIIVHHRSWTHPEKAYRSASWASTLALAKKAAVRWKNAERVEIVEALKTKSGPQEEAA